MRLSIITPSFNQGHLIGQTIESILQQQDGLDIEYIIIDGQSNDETSDVVKKYTPLLQSRGIRFVFISEPDDGQSDAINKGFKLATGDLLTYINSDDYYEPLVIGRVIEWFSNHPFANWGYGGWRLVNYNRNVYRTIQPTYFKRNRLYTICNIGQPSCFYRKDFLFRVGLLNKKLHLAMDYDLWLRMAKEEIPILLPFPIANMRYYMQTKSATRAKAHLIEAFQLQRTYTKGFFLRLAQIFYFIRGLLVILLKFDINNRIEKKFKKI